jgi:hypothetical protein
VLRGRYPFSVLLMPLCLLLLLVSGCTTVKHEHVVIKKEGMYLRDLCACYGIEYNWDVQNGRVVMIHPRPGRLPDLEQ